MKENKKVLKATRTDSYQRTSSLYDDESEASSVGIANLFLKEKSDSEYEVSNSEFESVGMSLDELAREYDYLSNSYEKMKMKYKRTKAELNFVKSELSSVNELSATQMSEFRFVLNEEKSLHAETQDKLKFLMDELKLLMDSNKRLNKEFESNMNKLVELEIDSCRLVNKLNSVGIDNENISRSSKRFDILLGKQKASFDKIGLGFDKCKASMLTNIIFVRKMTPSEPFVPKVSKKSTIDMNEKSKSSVSKPSVQQKNKVQENSHR